VDGVDPAQLQLCDEQGVTLAEALSNFGLNPAEVAKAARRPGEILAYVEAHIEQGPVLEAENLPIGVVTGIAAQLRLKATFKGTAGHAGTSPMHLRRDAVAAAAAAVLAVENICLAGPSDLRGTVGRFRTGAMAYNVIAGEAEIGIDLRAATNAVRDAAAETIKAELESIASARGIGLDFAVVQDLAACPCDPRLTAVMSDAVGAVGVKPFELLSGAGHDALAVSPLAPVAMLFIRCGGGVSHNPAETVNPADVDVAARALVEFIERLGELSL
jgi:allantoate deiminase